MRNPAAGLAVVGLGASLAAMDLAVNVAFPSVTAAFALATGEIRWLVVSYVLTYASLMLACGKLGDRIAVHTGDELEALADQFNSMAGRLQESYANLEQKVDARTAELSAALQQQTAFEGYSIAQQ